MADYDWFQSPTWSSEIEAAFEARLARARYHRPHYLYAQGWVLTQSSIASDRAVGRDLLRRCADIPETQSTFQALDALADSLAREGETAEALTVRNHARMLRAAGTHVRADHVAKQAFDYAESLIDLSPGTDSDVIMNLLDDALPELEVVRDRPVKFRARMVYASVLGRRGDPRAGRLVRLLLHDLAEAPDLFEQWLKRSHLAIEADLIVISDAYPPTADEPAADVELESDFVGLVQINERRSSLAAQIAAAPDGAPERERTVDGTVAEVLRGYAELPRLSAKHELAEVYRATEFLRRKELTVDAEEFQRLLRGRAEKARSIREYWSDAIQIMRGLDGLGYDTSADQSLYSLGEQRDSRVFSLLLEWIERSANRDVRLHLLHVLAFSKGAKPAIASPLIEIFRRIDPDLDPDPYSVRYSVANVISQTATDKHFDEVLALVLDPNSGDARHSFVEALSRMRKHRESVVPVLLSLLNSDSPHVYLAAAKALGQWRVPDAMPLILQLHASIDDRVADEDRRYGERHVLGNALKKFG